MTSISEKLLRKGIDIAGDHVVTDLRVGLAYTAVEVSGKNVGLAYTFRHDIGGRCTAVREAGKITGKPARELIGWIEQSDVLSRAIGLATLNALLQPHLGGSLGEDFLPFLRIGHKDKVGMVGFFDPLIEPVRQRCAELLIFERETSRGNGLLTPEDIRSRLPDCSIVILSATTLINRTFDHIMKYVRGAREIVLLGPSTPLVADIFQNTPITYLAGVKILNGGKTLQVVSEGGGTQRLTASGAVKKEVIASRK